MCSHQLEVFLSESTHSSLRVEPLFTLGLQKHLHMMFQCFRLRRSKSVIVLNIYIIYIYHMARHVIGLSIIHVVCIFVKLCIPYMLMCDNPVGHHFKSSVF